MALSRISYLGLYGRGLTSKFSFFFIIIINLGLILVTI